MSRAGSSSRKLPARTSSTSRHSAGEALWTDTARGRLLPAAIATIFVPLPRRVGPTARPPFSRSRRLHPRTLLPGSACPAHGGAAPTASAPPPVSPSVSTAGIGDGRSGTADTSQATRAIALRYPEPTTRRSAPRECHATDGHSYRPDAHHAAPAPQLPTVPQSIPSVLPSAYAETLRASPECTILKHQMFMRLVLASVHRAFLYRNAVFLERLCTTFRSAVVAPIRHGFPYKSWLGFDRSLGLCALPSGTIAYRIFAPALASGNARRMAARLSPIFGRRMAAHSVRSFQ
jgi:hypothetical protein